jgi:hypothetical protein
MKNLIYILLALGLASCRQTARVSPNELGSWLRNPDNGWCDIVHRDDYSFYAQCEPAVSKAIRASSPTEIMDESQVLQNAGSYSNLEYYTVTIRSNSGTPLLHAISESQQDYFSKQYYLTTEIQNDFLLSTGEGMFSPVMCMVERTYEATTETAINLAFPKSKEGKRKLMYTDKIIGIEPVMMEIDNTHVPELKF